MYNSYIYFHTFILNCNNNNALYNYITQIIQFSDNCVCVYVNEIHVRNSIVESGETYLLLSECPISFPNIQ